MIESFKYIKDLNKIQEGTLSYWGGGGVWAEGEVSPSSSCDIASYNLLKPKSPPVSRVVTVTWGLPIPLSTVSRRF